MSFSLLVKKVRVTRELLQSPLPTTRLLNFPIPTQWLTPLIKETQFENLVFELLINAGQQAARNETLLKTRPKVLIKLVLAVVETHPLIQPMSSAGDLTPTIEALLKTLSALFVRAVVYLAYNAPRVAEPPPMGLNMVLPQLLASLSIFTFNAQKRYLKLPLHPVVTPLPVQEVASLAVNIILREVAPLLFTMFEAEGVAKPARVHAGMLLATRIIIGTYGPVLRLIIPLLVARTPTVLQTLSVAQALFAIAWLEEPGNRSVEPSILLLKITLALAQRNKKQPLLVAKNMLLALAAQRLSGKNAEISLEQNIMVIWPKGPVLTKAPTATPAVLITVLTLSRFTEFEALSINIALAVILVRFAMATPELTVESIDKKFPSEGPPTFATLTLANVPPLTRIDPLA